MDLGKERERGKKGKGEKKLEREKENRKWTKGESDRDKRNRQGETEGPQLIKPSDNNILDIGKEVS